MVGNKDFIAHFSFQVSCLSGALPSSIQIDIGPNNHFDAPEMNDVGQPWNFCVPEGGLVQNAFSRRWTGSYGLTWRIGNHHATASRFKQCDKSNNGHHKRDVFATTSFYSKRGYTGSNDASAGSGWSNFNSVYDILRAAGTTFTENIYKHFWFLTDTITVFRGTTPQCQAISIKAETSEPVTFTFYSDLTTVSGSTQVQDGDPRPSARFYTNLPSYTDSSKADLPWELHVNAGAPDTFISAFVQYECIQPGDYITASSAAHFALSAVLVAIVALAALLF
jgi:hypothetical protein